MSAVRSKPWRCSEADPAKYSLVYVCLYRLCVDVCACFNGRCCGLVFTEGDLCKKIPEYLTLQRLRLGHESMGLI